MHFVESNQIFSFGKKRFQHHNIYQNSTLYLGTDNEAKAKSNYRGSAENQAVQKFYIHFFIDNSNVNFILYTLSCPKLKSGQLKVYKLMFALELSMKK